jgi:hypothetical protein
MSVHFAIPATSFTLRAMLQARVNLAYGAFPAPNVLIEPPPRPPATAAAPAAVPQPEQAGLYLYMHHAGPNPAWRNMHGSQIDASGKRVAAPPLVVDLHYMLAATGADLEREILLGIGMYALHRNAIMPRSMIQSLLAAVAVRANPDSLLQQLTTETLFDPAHQPEQITVAQAAVDMDMSTKLWSALQSPLRPAAYYLVTTVFLDTGELFATAPLATSVTLGVRPASAPTSPLPLDQLTTTG